MKVLVTGSAGFIGFHLVKRLSSLGYTVVGLDNINDYYDVELKYNRLTELGIDKNKIIPNQKIESSQLKNFVFINTSLEDAKEMSKVFNEYEFDIVCNLAAQAGVRYSIKNPSAYINSNVVGFVNLLECCKNSRVQHFVYASSSSVYGLNSQIPFNTGQYTDHPVSLYAATKKSNELIAHVYSHLFAVPTTGLRFFTVYGPWGRPDMAYFSFTNDVLNGKPIKIFNNGQMFRDFTYIDDVVDAISKVLLRPASVDKDWNSADPKPGSSNAPYKVYNIGNSKPVDLLSFVSLIERELGIEAKKQLLPMQPGDVYTTFADVTDLQEDFDFVPATTIEKGIKQFISWYKMYYRLEQPSII